MIYQQNLQGYCAVPRTWYNQCGVRFRRIPRDSYKKCILSDWVQDYRSIRGPPDVLEIVKTFTIVTRTWLDTHFDVYTPENFYYDLLRVDKHQPKIIKIWLLYHNIDHSMWFFADLNDIGMMRRGIKLMTNGRFIENNLAAEKSDAVKIAIKYNPKILTQELISYFCSNWNWIPYLVDGIIEMRQSPSTHTLLKHCRDAINWHIEITTRSEKDFFENSKDDVVNKLRAVAYNDDVALMMFQMFCKI